MVVLGVRDQAELEQWEQKLGGMGLETESFVEPDRNDEKTALAVAPMADGAPFKELRLL